MAETLQQIFNLCIVPLLAIITDYIVKLIRKKANQIDSQIKDQNLKKYTNMLSEAIQDAVVATNQTYVNALKEQQHFDEDAMAEAFDKTYEAVLSIIGVEGEKILREVYGDLNVYITTKIEAEVSWNKR